MFVLSRARHLRLRGNPRPGRRGDATAAALAVGAGGALAALLRDGTGDDKINTETSSAASRGAMCRCEAAAASILVHPTAGLETRAERLTQQKREPPQSTAKPAFDLKQTYDIVRILGEGAYGLVYHAKRKSDGRDVALKTMPREYTGQTDFEREVAALQLLRDKSREGQKDASTVAGREHIVQLYDLHRDEENYYLAMELVEGGELFDHLIAGGPFSEGLAANFLRQFAEGISYTHSNGLVHADLKPENLLLAKTDADGGSEDMSLKLVDFGCACSHDSGKDDMHLPVHEFAKGCSFLHLVALGNQFELEKMLLEKPSLVNFRDYDFRTPLHLAASEGHVEICRYLINKGARINRIDRWGGSPLDDAHRHKHMEVVRYLREHGAKFGNSATAITRFIEAASAGDLEEVKAMLEFGTLDMNAGDYDRRTALHLSCSEGRVKVVELLVLQEGADVNVEDRWGNRPLDDALRAKRNSNHIVKLLEARGATSAKLRPFASQRKKTQRKRKEPKTSSGTWVYWPPEMFAEGATPTPAIDMWAAGVIMYIVLTGTHPFDKTANKSDEEIKELLIKVGSCDGGSDQLEELAFDERVEGLSDSCVGLLRQLLHPDPAQRMTSEDFLRHPWIQGLTVSWKTMDAHEKHLRRRFKTNILKHFSEKGSGLQLRDIFNAIDIAGNGVLDANEIRIVLRSAGEPDDVINKIVSSLDFSRHGGKVAGVSWDTFQRIMELNDE